MKISNIGNTFRLFLLRSNLDWTLIPLLLIKEFSHGKSQESLSQFGEDLELAKICPESGIYIDIGAGRPISGSNTYSLYKQGWNGVLVDPIRINFWLSRLIRPKDSVFQACIGQERKIEFWNLFPYEYSTTSSVVARELIDRKKAQLVSTVEIPLITFEKIVTSQTSACLLLCIDAEGSDFEILQQFPFDVKKPDVICIEEPSSEEVREKDISVFLREKGYRFHRRLGLSVIYKLEGSIYLAG